MRTLTSAVTENDTVYNRGLDGEIISARGGGGSQYWASDLSYSYNGHGDTTNLTQQSSGIALAMTATYEYDAFGNCLATGGEADNNPFRYNGQYYDEESGLYYLRNRYYDPSIGRFTQEDPAKDGLNWYVYCDNDSINFLDPLGLYLYGLNNNNPNSSNPEERYDDSYKLLSYIKEMTKDEGFYVNKSNGYIMWRDVGGVGEGGSEIAASLIKSLSGPDSSLCVIFDEKTTRENSTGSRLGITVGTKDIDVSTTEGMQEMLASFVHEATHALADVKKFSSEIIYNFTCSSNDESSIKNYIDKKYQEALAITVEEAFRGEMGYVARSEVSDLMIGTNGYGQFPYILTHDPNKVFNKNINSVNLIGKCVGDFVIATTLRTHGTGIVQWLLDNY